MRRVIGVAVVLVLACGARGAQEKKDEPINGKLLIGKWEPKVLKKGELTSIEFTRDGKLIAIAEVGGKGARAEGTYKLEGNKLTFEVTYTGETTKETVTLLKLTDDEMESRDKEGKIDTYKRMKSK
jgi:uncharacterized protein (TIGR03066 family)